jgi:signal transduction histidine kinase
MRRLAAWLCLLLLWAAPAAHAQVDAGATAPGLLALRQAQAVLQPQGLPSVSRNQTLTHRWDEDFPGRGGTATYRITLPPHEGVGTMALLFTRVGNQVVASVNGVRALTLGTLGDPGYDAAKTAHMAVVDTAWLRAGSPNELVVTVTTQDARWGGLSSVRYGPEALVQREYDRERLWRYVSSIVFCVALGLLGVMALALWARLRDAVFSCFAAASFLGIVRNLDRVWPDVPVPWPAWGMIGAATYAWHLALMCLFALLVVGQPSRRLQQLLLAYLPLALLMVLAAFGLRLPWLWTAALVLLAPLGLASWLLVARQALDRGARHRMTAAVMTLAGGLALLAGLHDLGLVRIGLVGSNRNSLTPHTMFLFVVVMAGIIVDRYTRSAAGLKALNQTLEQRINAKEAQLQGAFDQLQAQQAAQATATERQRIMRDLHDGVGAQLVGLLNLVKQPDPQPGVLEEHVKAALDEMRLAVDSMQLADGDLTTALATLRYRVQPRLQAAGLALHWDVHELPALPGMTPRAVLQVQRIVLEALTNVLKHARAQAVWVNCRAEPGGDRIVLEVADDGMGLPAQPPDHPGQGVASMQARAGSIGATLMLAPRDGGGTVVCLRWPA